MNASTAIHPAILRAVNHGDLPASIADRYAATFDRCDDWHRPSNDCGNPIPDEYSLAARLHDLGMLDRRATCLHRGGGFRGYRIEFRQADWTRREVTP